MKHEDDLTSELNRAGSTNVESNVEYNELIDELTDDQLRKIMHEPVGPYVIEAYTTVMHLVQGLVLAALFFVITEQPQITPIIVFKLVISVGIVITIWHNVLTNTQYGSTTRGSIYNTLLPIVWGIFQVLLAFSFDYPLYIFILLMIPIYVIAILHTWDHIIKNSRPQAFKIWKAHFKGVKPHFVQDLFDEFTRFEKDTTAKCLYFTIVLGALTLFNYFITWNLEIQTYISLTIIGIFIIMANYFDLNRFFNNSEKLRKYGYKW